MARHIWIIGRKLHLKNLSNINQRLSPLQNSSECQTSVRIPELKTINVDYEEPKDYYKFSNEARCGPLVAASSLMKILNVTEANARNAVNQYPTLQTLTKISIYKNFYILRKAGINKSTIKENEYLLSDVPQYLKKKISLVYLLDIDMNEAVPLFHLPVTTLKTFCQKTIMDATVLPNKNRIHYLAEKFQCDISKVCRLLIYNKHMMSLPLRKLISVTEYLLEAGVLPHHIASDLIGYQYHLNTIKRKLERANEIGISPIRPWIIRCAHDAWVLAEMKQLRSREILGERTIQECLAEIFECDLEVASYLFTKNTGLSKVNIEKVIRVSKLLRRSGYTVFDVQRQPRVLHRKYESLEKRLKQWKRSRNGRLPLNTLLFPEAKFQRALNNHDEKNDVAKNE